MSETEIPFTEDDRLTPPEVLKNLGRFTLDPCVPMRLPWPTADRHYNILDNGLSPPWSGRVWLNPPYSDIEPWIAKLLRHLEQGGTGMGLYNARTETEWFFNGVWRIAEAVFFPKARYKFYRPDGTRQGNGKMGSVIAAYSEQDAQILCAAQFDGKFIALKWRVPVNIRTTWRNLVRSVMSQAGGVIALEGLYKLVSGH